jgi:TP901 family phage tail tape measure protein
MARARVGVEFTPVDARKVEAALARIQAQAKGVNFGRGAESINKLSRPLGKITGQATEFQKSLEASNARVLAFGASVAVINKLSEAFGALVSNTIKVEATFAKINTILGGTRKEIQQFGDGIFKVAQQTGTSFDQVAEGALELARQGLSVEQTLSRVETSLKLVRVSGIDSQKAVAGLTAAIKGFEGTGLTVAQIADKLAEVDTKFAVSTEDLINGLERASASARTAGVSFDELLGVVTTVQERTQRGGAVIGNAFKTIFARLNRADTLKTLQNLGIEVLDAGGNVRSAIPLFQDLAVELDKLGLKSVEAGNIIQKVAGVRQRDILINLVEDLNSGQSQFAKSLEVSANYAGKLDAKNAKLNDTLEALINNLTVGGQKLASVMGELGFTDSAKDILKIFSSIVTGVTDILQGESVGAKFAQGIVKGIGSVLTGPGLALVGAIFSKLFIDLVKFGRKSLQQVLGINQATQQQNALQQSVLQTLLQNESIQREILALEGNKVAQEQLLLKIYNQQAAALARVQKAAATVTPGLFGAGLRGGEKGVATKGKAADGYIAAEARDVSRGVGGAPSSAKVVSIPNFAFGGGKRGTIVANTSEYFVPNYANGGDAIFNQDMVRSMGLPAGAKKINAAGGYVPNFARPRSLERLRGLAKGTGPEAAAAKAELAKRKKAKAKRPMMSLNATGKYGMIVPDEFGVGNASYFISETKKGPSATKTRSDNTVAEVRVPIYGLNKGKLRGSSGEKLAKDFTKLFTNKAIEFALKVSGGVLPNPVRRKEIEKTLNIGSARSAAGSVFESGIAALFSDDDFDDFQRRGASALIDFKGGALRGLQGNPNPFNIPKGVLGLEAKYSRNADMQKSAAEKIYKVLGQGKAAFASGYIPNFAGGLENAIMRERAAGLPLNQIRINQNGKLRNAQNPMGLAVTNTRDEPTGAIPNFAKYPIGVSTRFKKKGGGESKAAEKLNESLEKTSNAFDMSITKLFALQIAVSSLTQVVGDSEDKWAEVSKGLGEVASSTVNTALVLQTVGAKPFGKGKGVLGGGAATPFFSKLGRLNKFIGPTLRVFGALSRFAGPIALGFTALNTAVKLFAGKSIFRMVGEGLGLVATESEKFAERISKANDVVELTKEKKSIDAQIEATRSNIQSKKKSEFNDLLFTMPFSLFSLSKEEEKLKKLLDERVAVDERINNLTKEEEQAKATKRRITITNLQAVKKIQRSLAARRRDVESEFTGLSGENVIKYRVNYGRGSNGIDMSGVGMGLTQAGIDIKRASGVSRQESRNLDVQEKILKIEKEFALAKEDSIKAIAKASISTENLKEADKERVENVVNLVKAGADYEKIQEALSLLSDETLESFLKQVDSQELSLDLSENAKNAAIERARAEGKVADEIARQQEGLLGYRNKAKKELNELEKDVPARLAENLESSLGNAMNNLAKGTYDSLGDVFLNIALDFGNTLMQEINSAVAKSLVQSFTGSSVGKSIFSGIGSFFGTSFGGGGAPVQKNSGGLITGGSGVRDDVPAVLTGGEYVIKKSAVQKYGLSFMNGLNSGGLRGYQSGGYVQGADNLRKGKFWSNTKGNMVGGALYEERLKKARGMDFFVPGTRGAGSIVGKENLLAFSQQKYTSGATDVISSRAGGASINLEDQSLRLTAFGRRRDSPAKRALEDAQAQAYDLYTQGVAEEKRVVEENKQAKKARSKALKQAVIGSFVNATMAGVSAGLNNVNQGGSFFGAKATENLRAPVDMMTKSGEFIKKGQSLAGVKGMTQQVKTGTILGRQQYGIGLTKQARGAINAAKLNDSMFQSTTMGFMNGGMFGGNSSGGVLGERSTMDEQVVTSEPQEFMNGGLFGANKPNALLSGGEYVIGKEAASAIGEDTLDSINMGRFANGGSFGSSGGGSGAGSDGGADVGEVNITINVDKDGKASAKADGSGEEDPTKTKEFAKKIKDVVLNVINEEKRVSGSLFTRNK